MLWPKYCITKVLYYKSKQRCYGQSIVLQNKVNKVFYYKSKQRCYGQSIVLQR